MFVSVIPDFCFYCLGVGGYGTRTILLDVKKKRERDLVIAIDPLLSVIGVRDKFLRLKPQIDLILCSLWSITSMDYVPGANSHFNYQTKFR